MNSIFTSSLIAPNGTQNGNQDTWGNVKIPRIESLSNDTPKVGQWYPVPEEEVVYTSLVGIPVKAVSKTANSTFIIQASYFSLNCPDGPQWVANENEIVWSRSNWSISEPLGGYIQGTKKSAHGVGASRF